MNPDTTVRETKQIMDKPYYFFPLTWGNGDRLTMINDEGSEESYLWFTEGREKNG